MKNLSFERADFFPASPDGPIPDHVKSQIRKIIPVSGDAMFSDNTFLREKFISTIEERILFNKAVD